MVKSKNSQKEVKRSLVCVYIYMYIYIKNVLSKDCNKKDQHEFLSTHNQFSHHFSWFSATQDSYIFAVRIKQVLPTV